MSPKATPSLFISSHFHCHGLAQYSIISHSDVCGSHFSSSQANPLPPIGVLYTQPEGTLLKCNSDDLLPLLTTLHGSVLPSESTESNS